MSKLSLSALLLASIVGVAAAQETAKPPAEKAPRADRGDTAERDRGSKSERDRDSKSETGDVDQKQNMNQMLASCVAIGNQHEIALTQFAMAHIEHPEIKKFAQMLHDEHTQIATKLEKFASKEANMTFAAVDNEANRESTRTKQPERKITQAGFKGNEPTDRATDKSAHSGSGNQNHMLTLEREITQKCLLMTEKELTEAKSRGEIDQAFLGCQIAGHIGMIAKLSVFEKEADGELAQVLMDGRAASEKHLAEAKRLMATLSGDAKNKNAQTANGK